MLPAGIQLPFLFYLLQFACYQFANLAVLQNEHISSQAQPDQLQDRSHMSLLE